MSPKPDLKLFSVSELLELSRGVLSELRCRHVIRTTNAPAGDYAEWLTMLATDGELAPNSEKSWDVKAKDERLIQVKARVVVDPENRGQRQLSAFRSWDFTDALVVLFDERYGVWKATRFSVEQLKENSSHTAWVKVDRVLATDKLLEQGEDWTRKMCEVAERQDEYAPA
jgi:hypothetical protein